MGVNFFECECCNTSICDCGSFFTCNKCFSKLCDDCANQYYDENTFLVNCPFCSLELIKDYDLLNFALGVLGVTREELEEDYRKMER